MLKAMLVASLLALAPAAMAQDSPLPTGDPHLVDVEPFPTGSCTPFEPMIKALDAMLGVGLGGKSIGYVADAGADLLRIYNIHEKTEYPGEGIFMSDMMGGETVMVAVISLKSAAMCEARELTRAEWSTWLEEAQQRTPNA